ncbi:hypothetical protein ABL78_4818 [Leptomonas seymouri]|uniref:Oxidation resistance protein 1 n=1 Tax=Leptomonas seymouri TaxID=5684 RepID=A0A0N0P572_LEPSE|nr:hypothetical protein ABL78_4818 [Leptomonas seymouri]|eukprot:KPI86126.1 hypothetical protein ABL78_4818 [Leptomonas seymouri]
MQPLPTAGVNGVRAEDISAAPSPAARLCSGVSPRITLPGTAHRILPVFPPPGCHFYDPYLNCFQHRPEVLAELLEAARRYEAHRLAALHADDDRRCSSSLAFFTDTSSPSPDDATPGHAGLRRQATAPCKCGLQAAQLFAACRDAPQPPLPLSKCELHEVLLSLPPRWQNYPWKLCFDTARDGFSLSSLYRCMDAVEDQQMRANTVAFGLFFVCTRGDTLLRSAAAVPPTSASSSLGGSLLKSGNLRSLYTAQRSASLRCGAARGSLPYGVIGCFTPEVPSLLRHTANVYYGSAESYVFRLDQLDTSSHRGDWMLRGFDLMTGGRAAEAAAAGGSGAEAGGASRQCRRHTPTDGMPTSVQQLAQMANSVSYAHVPVPMPTRMMMEHFAGGARAPEESEPVGGGNADAHPPLSGASAGSVLAEGSPAFHVPATVAAHADASAACAASSNPITPSRHGEGAAAPRPLHVPPLHIVPRAPLLSKYGWSGQPYNRKFIVCNPHFLALGAGSSGAALHVDENLQFGTSSNWCETYSSPSLFGARTPESTPVSLLTSPTHQAAAAVATDPSRGATNSLPHREFAISRVVWFTITEDRRMFRLMNGAGTETVTPEAAGEVAAGDDNLCRCGRAGNICEQDATEGMDLSTSAGLPYLHQCDLLPFTEQPY